jgi:LPS-assembly lipoprotein
MRLAFAFVALAALSACGFKPMYAPPAAGGAVIGQVSVPEVPGKSGHAFRTELTRLLAAERSAGPIRQLDVTVNETVAQLGLRVDESATRADLLLTGAYVLHDVDGRDLVRGSASVVASYDIPVSAFGAAAAQDDARERAGVMLAQRVRADLALRLERLRTHPPAGPVQVLPAPTAPTPEPEGLPPPLTSPGQPQAVQPPK